MKTRKTSEGLRGESTHSDQNCKLSDNHMIKESSDAVNSGAGSKGSFSCRSINQKGASGKISQSLRDTDNGAGSKGLFGVNIDW